jgi:fructose-1,6-bisphosphatase/inositol monophosphatase family enzyme
MASEFLEAARPIALEAGQRVLELRRSPLIKERKADYSIVTNADKEADALIQGGLRKAFPGHTMLTEESGMLGDPGAEYVWVIDPIDGTRAYARGTPGFSVMIGLMKRGKPFAGIVYDPSENVLFEAQTGLGSWVVIDGKSIKAQVSNRREWPELRLITSTDFPPVLTARLKDKLPGVTVPSLNSVGVKIGQLVRQAADLYVNHHAYHYWDSLAPQVILEEAGGVFTYADGRPLLYDLQSDFQHPAPPIASNGQRHSEFVRIVSEIL